MRERVKEKERLATVGHVATRKEKGKKNGASSAHLQWKVFVCVCARGLLLLLLSPHPGVWCPA